MTTKYRAGRDVVSYCGKCAMMLTHVIHAVGADGIPARVECNTCHAVHRYRPNLPGTKTRKSAGPRAAKTPKKTKKTPEELFDAFIAEIDTSSPLPYNIGTTFEADAVIIHKKFGVGVVTKVLIDNKFEASFRDGQKTLIHNRDLD